MSKYIGRRVSIGIAKEAVRGTAESTPTFFVPQIELTLDEKITQAVDESTVDRIEDSVGAKLTERMSLGTIRGHIRDKEIGLWLLASIGAVSTSLDDPESGVNKHTFSVLNSAQHPSLTLTEKSPDVDRAYALMMLDTFSMNVTLNELISFVATFRSKKSESATTTVIVDEQTKFVPQFATFKTAANLAGLSGASAVKIKVFNLTITKNLEDDRNFGSTDPDDILNKQFMIDGTVELLFDDSSFEDFVTGDTQRAMRIDLVNTDVTIGASTNPSLKFDLAKVKFSEIARTQGINDLVAQTLTFKGFFSLSDSKSIEAELINTQVSY